MNSIIRNIAVTCALALGLGLPRLAEAAAPAAAVKKTVDPLTEQEARLDAALKDLDPNSAPPDLVPAARARIQEARALLKDDPKSKDAPGWIAACSLMTEAAVVQVHGEQARSERVRLQDERIKTQAELVATQDEIFKLERGYASSLKADLDDQKKKAADAKEDAEKRFSQLNSALIQVSRDARGTIISMSDILFDVGKATLTQDLKTNLAKIAGILTIYKDANVQVEGHTDNVGGEEYNQKLSEKRAENVMQFLVTPGGIAQTRLTSMGYGFSKPIADNATKEGRQKNRRVDLVIMDKKTP
ncbi:MAG: OmpA family protein [Fibrobacteres bacterium]|jgi:outer membrane protein OmpA-like peptidoglycan-associated protein|nr:OmpA family protein [Fibrobacterota bacterium]